MTIALNPRSQWTLGVALAALLVLTRGAHIAALHALPPASWAVFFLAGVYLRSRWAFVAYMALAVASDAWAIGWQGVSSYCVTPAYALLLPAYAALWRAGRWYAARHVDALRTLPALVVAVFASAVVCELLSSGGFYFLGGRFVDPTLAVFAERFVRYFPGMLWTMAFWVAVAALVHAAFVAARLRGTTHPAA